jgi:hypothetical protein
MNYERIINYIKQVCLNHPLVNGVGYGEISDVVSNDTGVNNFPYVFINPGTIQNTTNNANLNVNLICITQTFNNELDIVRWQSTCYQILNDVIAYINQDDTYDPLLDLTNNWTINVFKERFKDDVVGATANITFTYYSPLDNCDNIYIPITKSGIIYPRQIPWDGQPDDVDGSVYWHRINGSYNYTPPLNPINTALKRNDYYGSDSNSLLIYDNAFGNKFRFTNDIGQQFIEGFHTSVSNNSPNKKYCIDNLTGLGYYLQTATTERVNRNFSGACSYIKTFTYNDYSNFRPIDMGEYLEAVSYADITTSYNAVYAPFVDTGIRSYGGAFWTGTFNWDSRYWVVASNGNVLNPLLPTATADHLIMVRNHFY